MTTPKKKTTTNVKTKTAAKKPASKKPSPTIAEAEKALKSEANEVVKKKEERAKAPSFLNKKPEEFTVGTKDYGAVVSEFNKCFGSYYNTNRVPPFIFKTMLDRLRKFYALNE